MCRVRFKAKERYTTIADSRTPGAWKGSGDEDVQPARRISKQGCKRQDGYDIIDDGRAPGMERSKRRRRRATGATA